MLKTTMILGAAALAISAAPARAAVTYYGDATSFAAAADILETEDFDNARVLDQNFTGPLSSSTTNIAAGGSAAFLPGDVVPGVVFSDSSPNLNFRAASVDGSPILEANARGTVITIAFPNPVTAVSLDVFNFSATGAATVDIYDASGEIGQDEVPTGQTTPGYFAVTSTDDITALTVTSSDILPGIDNVAFGSAAVQTAVPEPGSLAILGSGLLALATIRRRRSRAGK